MGESLELLRGAKTNPLPKKVLFVHTITMLDAVTTAIEGRHFAQWREFSSQEKKPTHSGVALGSCRRVAYDPNHGHDKAFRLFEVKIFPTGNL